MAPIDYTMWPMCRNGCHGQLHGLCAAMARPIGWTTVGKGQARRTTDTHSRSLQPSLCGVVCVCCAALRMLPLPLRTLCIRIRLRIMRVRMGTCYLVYMGYTRHRVCACVCAACFYIAALDAPLTAERRIGREDQRDARRQRCDRLEPGCVVQTANMGHHSAGGDSCWCPELESRTTPEARTTAAPPCSSTSTSVYPWRTETGRLERNGSGTATSCEGWGGGRPRQAPSAAAWPAGSKCTTSLQRSDTPPASPPAQARCTRQARRQPPSRSRAS